MITIDCYKEKCALIAYYFCEKEKVAITQKAVFEIWKSWWKDDFRKKGQPVYKMDVFQLAHNKNARNKDDAHLRECNKLFQKSYKWIKDYALRHTKQEVRDKVVRQRIKQLAELKSLASQNGSQAFMPIRDVKGGHLAHYLLVGKDFRKDGNYDSLLQYLKCMQG